MLQWEFRQALRLIAFLTGLSLICSSITRIFQPGLPSLLYSTGESATLYLAQAGCPLFVQTCAAEGQPLLEGLYFLWSTAYWSPDGHYVAVHQVDGWALYPAACLLGQQLCQPFLLGVPDNRITWGPDGSVLAAVNRTGTTLNLLSRACWDGSPRDLCVKHHIELNQAGAFYAPYWSANGERIVLTNTAASSLKVFDIRCLDSACVDETTPVIQRAGLFWPVLSPNGTQVLFAADAGYSLPQVPRKQLFLGDLITGRVERLTYTPYEATMPDWSRDGRYVAFSGFATSRSGDLALYLMDINRRLTVRFLSRPGVDLLFPSWAPNDH